MPREALATNAVATPDLNGSTPELNGRGHANGRGNAAEERALRPPIYCLVPRDLADELGGRLLQHWIEDSSVAAIPERRGAERRRCERRNAALDVNGTDRRRIHSIRGRRVADRRAPVVDAALSLPRCARRHADKVRIVQRVALTQRELREQESARLIVAFQGGDELALPELYSLYFEEVYSYLRVFLRDDHEAEDATQQTFLNVLEALPRYERRPGVRFASWLFRIARNEALMHHRKNGRVQVEEPSQMALRCTQPSDDEFEAALGWISDGDLMRFIETLPEGQRQALSLRYMLGMDTAETAEVLERTPQAVRKLEHRALRFLEKRLATMGRGPTELLREPMIERARPAPVTRARRVALAEGMLGTPCW